MKRREVETSKVREAGVYFTSIFSHLYVNKRAKNDLLFHEYSTVSTGSNDAEDSSILHNNWPKKLNKIKIDEWKKQKQKNSCDSTLGTTILKWAHESCNWRLQHTWTHAPASYVRRGSISEVATLLATLQYIYIFKAQAACIACTFIHSRKRTSRLGVTVMLGIKKIR